jgi:hypothetical protein
MSKEINKNTVKSAKWRAKKYKQGWMYYSVLVPMALAETLKDVVRQHKQGRLIQ